MLKTAFRSPCCRLCTIRSKSGATKSQILPSKCQIQIVKLQNLNQVKVLQLLVPISALKVIEELLQKAQNRRLKVTTVIYRIHDRKFCQFFENNSWKIPFFYNFLSNWNSAFFLRIPRNFTVFRIAGKLCPYLRSVDFNSVDSKTCKVKDEHPIIFHYNLQSVCFSPLYCI